MCQIVHPYAIPYVHVFAGIMFHDQLIIYTKYKIYMLQMFYTVYTTTTQCKLPRCKCSICASADSPLAHVVVSPSATCAGCAFSSSHWHKYCTQATCTVWWWSVVVICSCMWRWRYIQMKTALTLEQLALCGGSPQWYVADVCGGRIYFSTCISK